MSEIKHTSLKGELLYLIGRATAPMSGAELYEKSELADEIVKVSKALANLQSDGKIVRAAGEGRARYKLADGVAAPAPAGKMGRSKAVQKDDAAQAPLTGVRPAPEPALPKLDIPTLGLGESLGGAAGKTQRKPDPSGLREKGREEAAHHAASAGGKIEVHLPQESAALADAIIAASREQLAPGLEGGPQWWIDQDGGLEIADRGDVLLIEFTRDQARRMAEMILATHDVLGEFA